jgi:hypothetical protein
MNISTPAPDNGALTRVDLREIVRLMNRYGLAKFGDEWEPGASNAWLAGGKRLEELLDKLDRTG